MDEKKYPIYEFWVRLDDKDYNVVGTKMLEEVPRCWESSLAVFTDWANANLNAEHHNQEEETYTIRSLNLEIIGAGWKFLRDETWCGGWFQHYTYNIHLSDEELLASFEEYVERQSPYTNKDSEPYERYLQRVPKDERICLMGAEDRWRWKGPCRCEHCQERGVVMIDH